MKKRFLSLLVTLAMLLCLAPAAMAAETTLPDLESFSDGVFTKLAQTEYAPCMMQSYRADKTAETDGQLQRYYDWLKAAGMVWADEHTAPFGRFGAYSQEATWGSLSVSGLTPFSMNLVDTTTGNCHVFLALKEFNDHYELELFYSKEIQLAEYVAPTPEPIEIVTELPSFEQHAGQSLLRVDWELAGDGMPVYVLDEETYLTVLETYAELLQETCGFGQLNAQQMPDGRVIWFEPHPGCEPYELFDLSWCGDIKGVTPLGFVVANVEGGGVGVLLLYQAPFTIAEPAYASMVPEFGDVMTPAAEATPAPAPTSGSADSRPVLPDFAAYAGAAFTASQVVDGTAVYTMPMENLSACRDYLELLESYGLYQFDQSEESFGLPMYLWIEQCSYADVALRTKTIFEFYKIEYYLLFTIDMEGENVLVSVEYVDGFNVQDTGERWNGAPIVLEEEADPAPETVPALPTPEPVQQPEEAAVAIPSLVETIGDVTLSSESHENGIQSYQYKYRYGDSCYRLMQRMVDDMIATGYFEQAGFSTYSDMHFWQMRYIGGGTLSPIGEVEGGPYHVELGCYATWVASAYTTIAGVNIKMPESVTYGGDYSAPQPEIFSSEGALVTVRDFAQFMGGTRLLKAERRDNGSAYYQYNYDYGDSVYSMLSMYANELVHSGLFQTVDVQRSEVACFYYLEYIGPNADQLQPIGAVSSGQYHVQLGCANYTYMDLTNGSLNFVSIHLGADIAMAETTWTDGYAPTQSELEEISGFVVKYRTVERSCYVCYGSGKCRECNGTGTYRAYGQAVDCPTVCSFCDGKRVYEDMEAYYESK